MCPQQCHSRILLAGSYSTGTQRLGRSGRGRDLSVLHISKIQVHGALVQNDQLVKVIHSSSFSAPVAKTADLAYLTTTENRSICVVPGELKTF